MLVDHPVYRTQVNIQGLHVRVMLRRVIKIMYFVASIVHYFAIWYDMTYCLKEKSSSERYSVQFFCFNIA